MIKSKALKEFTDHKRSKIYDWWIESKIGDIYYKVVYRLIEKPIYTIKRLYQWQMNVFRYDYDFDGHCLFAIMEYKLKRLKKVLENGHAVQEPKDMKALRIAIKLAGRLKEDKYGDSFHRRHDRKWGELKTWFTPCHDNSNCSLWNSSRPKANTPEEIEQEQQDFLASYKEQEAKIAREEDWFYGILRKYLRSWWD